MPTCGITYRFFSCIDSFSKMKIESGLGCYYLVVKSCLDSLVTPWTVAHQAPLSMGFSRQEYWRGLTSPSSGDLPDLVTVASWVLAELVFLMPRNTVPWPTIMELLGAWP